MRCSLLLAAAAVVLAFASPQVAEASICGDYASTLGVPQLTLMQTLITRVVFGVNNQTTVLGNSGTFVGLRKITTGTPRDILDVVSATNFGAISSTITLVGSTGDQIVGVARRPNNTLFYFLDQNGKVYSGDVDTAIRTSNTNVILTPLSADAVAARTTNSPNRGVGFAFNPVGDAIRIVNGVNNFRVSPATGAAAGGGGGSADGTDTGNTFTYQTPQEGDQPINMVATAYTNQVGDSPRVGSFGTVQYGIDAGNARFVVFNNSNGGVIGANFPITVNGAAVSSADLLLNTGLTVVSRPGGAGNVVVAAITQNSVSGLHTINPATGVATPVASGFGVNAYRAIAFTTATGSNGVIEPKNAVPGIAGTSNIVGFFNRGIRFEDDQEDYTSGEAFIELRDKLVRFFGVPLGCDATQVPRPASDAPSQYVVHQNMNITKAQFDAFNGQVAATALSFGITSDEVGVVGGVLQSFARQTIGPSSNAICTQVDCDCAPGFGPVGNCQSVVNTTSSSSSSTGNGNPSSSSSTAPNVIPGGAAAGLSAPFALVAALALAVAALRA